ncbi:hypothetical protein [Bacillus sp. EAC]|uniref:hypothetical protein n=1 Tax=Bacillus sp. EAC TaxID=1978338 RepID=UPI000B42DDC6|nr:hypothetical protein [Bacillus sp. EAC]
MNMRNGLILVVSIFIILILTYRTINSDFEFGKYENMQEAIQKEISSPIIEILYSKKYHGVTVVIYTTEPNKDELPDSNFDAIAVAFLQGSDQNGWKNIGPNGWTHYENNNMTFYTEGLHDYDEKGNVMHEFYLTFGEIKNSMIEKVQTCSTDSKTFEDATIFTHSGMRYYIYIGEASIVQGLSKDGKVIDRQGG